MCVRVRNCERAGVNCAHVYCPMFQWNINALNHHQQFKLQLEELLLKRFGQHAFDIVFIIKGLVFICIHRASRTLLA